MTTTTAVHALIKAALVAAGVNAVDGPADDLPTDGGLIAQAAVLWPLARLNAYTRMSGRRSGGADGVLITCIGATTNDALAVADRVDGALGGLVLSPKGSPLRQVDLGIKEPAAEPNADPRRVSLPVAYSTITKG